MRFYFEDYLRELRPPNGPSSPTSLPYIECRLPTRLFRVDPARFQFKGDVDQHGVDPDKRLAGEYIEFGTGRLIVWMDLDQNYWVCDGHHRLDLARRVGKEDLPVYLLRAVDGWTAEMPIAAAAHANILNETGEVEDYVRFFRNSQISEPEATERGLLGRKRGRDAWAIAKKGVDDLYAFYMHDTSDQAQAVAAAIAEAAPNDERLQAIGLQYYRDGVKDHLEISLYVRGLRHLGSQPELVQTDLFGPDYLAEHKAKTQAAMTIIKRCRAECQDLKQAIKKQGRLRLTESRAAELGITDPGNIGQLQSALKRLSLETYKWEHWLTDPDKAREVTKMAGEYQKELAI